MIDKLILELTRNKHLVNQEIISNEAIFNSGKSLIKNSELLEFIKNVDNGGFFYRQSLQIYGFSDSPKFCDLIYVNMILNEKFGLLFKGLISFGQDIFGNQFAFDEKDQKYMLFDVESGSKKSMGSNLAEFLSELFSKLSFYTGEPYLNDWLTNKILKLDERLCPKIPFIIGGKYSIDNLFSLEFPKYLSLYSDIASQIHSLKDGQKIELKITHLDK